MTPVHPNADLIRAFYDAFQRRDHQTMAACYAPGARFSDPVFGDLVGPKIAAMWHMLCRRATDLRLEVSDILADGQAGAAHWEAWYTFSVTGRPVHNRIDARFEFAGSKILRHIDTFDLYAWARQALGLKGVVLGWAPPVQRAIRTQAMRGLDSFLVKQEPPGGSD